MMKRKSILLSAVILAFSLSVMTVSALPSLGNLHNQSAVTLLHLDDGNTAEVLTEAGVFTSQAVAAQYMDQDSSGNAVETGLSRLIHASSSCLTETGMNGQGIIDEIPSVKALVSDFRQEAGDEFDLSKLEQLTYFMDLKYISTGYRVIPGAETSFHGEMVPLEDGTIAVTVEGSEILRSGKLEDFVILLMNPNTEGYSLLRMQEYDPETGRYTLVLPTSGPTWSCRSWNNEGNT